MEENEKTKLPDTIKVSFETQNQFRMLAPESVAQGMLLLCENEDDELELKKHAANMMDLIQESVPTRTTDAVNRLGKKTTTTTPAYNAFFSESMIKDINARFKELAVSKAHKKRFEIVKENLLNFKPTISLGEALYRLSFYLIPNDNNLAKSTNNLIAFTERIFQDTQNNMLVDSAMLLGGQGKSTVQNGLRRAAERIGFATAACQLPTYRDGVQEAFVRNEICIDEDSKFEKIDYESLNKILDKSTITIKGKYIKEWSARSIANLLVGTNFLPTDVNARRYAIRMADENFKLEENFGKWEIPGKLGGGQTSYDAVVDWTTEGWLNLFYYCNKYRIKRQTYQETSFDYGLLYRIKKALNEQGSNVASISDMIKFFEQVEGDRLDWRLRQSFKNKLYMLANQLKLEVVGERKKNMYNTYDWTAALEIDDKPLDDPLERVYCYFHNNPDFDITE